MRFQDRVVWITGASSGIGEALAAAFRREGARLALSARRAAELERVARGLGDGVMVLPMDVTETAALDQKVQAVLDRFGRIDILVNNAGVSQRSLVADTAMETYRRLLEVNLLAPVALTRAVLPVMVRQRSGHIVVTSSVAGKFGTPLRSGYCASKHALHGFFDSLRAEVWRENIHVSTIVAGSIRTSVSMNALTGDGSAYGKMDPGQAAGIAVEEAAQRILDGIARRKDEIEIARGREKRALLLKRFLPGLLFRMMRTARVT